ncbi:MAG: M1 family metallopeptidase [Nocardioides sp.]
MIRCRLLALAVAAGVAATSLAAVQPATAAPPPGHGAPGIGDPYFPLDGNGGIDVLRYDVHDRYRFVERRLSGRTRVTLVATEDLAGFNLDFLLRVRSVKVGGRDVRFDQDRRHELAIHRAMDEGDRATFVVRYTGRPGKVGYAGERNWLASRHEVVAMNQPHMAPWWFPANDHPRDRAAIRISITVPKGKQVIANGKRVGRVVHGKRATTTWKPDEPMVPYLAFFAAGDFDIDRGRDHGSPWLVAVSERLAPSTQAHAMQLLRRSAALQSWIEDALGADYPFSTTGGVATSLDSGFALENQTRPTYSPRSLDTLTVVHELAHQWFGDSVTVHGWADIWLNEGAATFFEVLYDEEHGGPTGEQWLRRVYDDLGAGHSLWGHEVADPCPDPSGCSSVNDIFATHVYLRGAMTVQALRNRLGDDDLFEVLRRWVTERGGTTGTTAQFEALAEEVGGEDLAPFFESWLHTAEKPADTAVNGLG